PCRSPRRFRHGGPPPHRVRGLVRTLRHLAQPAPRRATRRRARALCDPRAVHTADRHAADRLPRVARCPRISGLAPVGSHHRRLSLSRSPAHRRRPAAARPGSPTRRARHPRAIRAHLRARTGQVRPTRERPSCQQYFMTITRQVAERSTCNRAKVGAVIVRDKNILATGYNGSPAGLPHCNEVGCLVYTSRTPSGETAENGASIRDADIYITHTPCIHCLKVLINTGIRRIFYEHEYKRHTLDELL